MTGTGTSPRPPFEPELEAVLTALSDQLPVMGPETLAQMRAFSSNERVVEQLIELGLVCRDVTIAGHEGAEIVATVVSRAGHTGTGPGIYHIHGGGMIAGLRMDGLLWVAPWLLAHDAVAVTVEYRRAPEHQDPVPVEDSYAGLTWMAEHAAEIGVDPDRILIAGASAGGGLAAGVALLARDRQGPKLIGQMLIYPMLDDRHVTVSAGQYDGLGVVWDRTISLWAWECLLGDSFGGDDVSIYAAPSRATDLTGLPPAFIDAGSAECFRDEDVAFASALWAAGVQAELHVWPGGFHGFDGMAPHAAISKAAVAARDAWVARLFG